MIPLAEKLVYGFIFAKNIPISNCRGTSFFQRAIKIGFEALSDGNAFSNSPAKHICKRIFH